MSYIPLDKSSLCSKSISGHKYLKHYANSHGGETERASLQPRTGEVLPIVLWLLAVVKGGSSLTVISSCGVCSAKLFHTTLEVSGFSLPRAAPSLSGEKERLWKIALRALRMEASCIQPTASAGVFFLVDCRHGDFQSQEGSCWPESVTELTLTMLE